MTSFHTNGAKPSLFELLFHYLEMDSGVTISSSHKAHTETEHPFYAPLLRSPSFTMNCATLGSSGKGQVFIFACENVTPEKDAI